RAAQTRTEIENRPRTGIEDTNPSTLPESMRIQQQADRANPPGPDLITKGGGTTSQGQVPNVPNSSEQNRLDTAAPSAKRVQIDDLSSVRPNPAPTTTVQPTEGVNSGTLGMGTSTSPNGALGASRPLAPASTSRSSSHSSH